MNKNALEQEQASCAASLGEAPRLQSEFPIPQRRTHNSVRTSWPIRIPLSGSAGLPTNWTKLLPNMRAGVFYLAAMFGKGNRATFLDPGAWTALKQSSGFSQFANISSDLFNVK